MEKRGDEKGGSGWRAHKAADRREAVGRHPGGALRMGEWKGGRVRIDALLRHTCTLARLMTTHTTRARVGEPLAQDLGWPRRPAQCCEPRKGK